ncbi:MAG: serine/threonine-protein kinase, partial [Byssovorax sp.]
VVGTPYYMSPEQARGSSAIDARTDIYAMGVLLYQATTGQVPYQAETFNELLFKIVLEVAPPPQTYVTDLDPEFAGIILRAMAREPDLRFQSCAEFAAALHAFQSLRASNLPPLPRPSLPNRPPATQVLDLASMPPLPAIQMQPQHSASWPGNAPADPTLPLQGSPIRASGPSWAQGGSSQQPQQQPQPQQPLPGSPSATGASWGNASTAIAPRSKTPMILGAVGAVAIVGVLAVVGVVAMGKPKTGPAAGGGAATAAPTASAAAPIPPATPSATPTAVPSEIASAAPSAAALAAPTASAKPSVAPTPTPKLTGKLPVKPPTTPTTRPGKPTKPGDLGY